MKIYNSDRLMDEFYASAYYDPLADLPRENIKYAIDFMLDALGDDMKRLAECAQELSENVNDRDGLSNNTEITLDLVHDLLKED
jgi:hypothetical protein